MFDKPVPFPIAFVEPEFIDFAEERLELGYDYGVVGGPEFKTEVIEVLDGREQRNVLRYLPLGRWQLGQRTIAISEKDHIEDLKYFRDFHEDRKGAKQGFRFKDWADYRAKNQLIAIGDGVRTQFQLRKAYLAGNAITYRPIQKPVFGTVDLFVDGVNVAVNPDHTWVVDHQTGIVSNDIPLDDGAVLTANFEFDVPVWFESDELPIRLGYYDPETNTQLYDLGSVFVVEERLPLTLPWLIGPQAEITEDLNLGIVYQTTEKFQFSTTKQVLASGFVNKQSKRDDRRILFDYGDRTFNQAELSTLLGYFWNARGKAGEFTIVDKGNQYVVRFNSDRLNIKFEAADSNDALFKVSGLKLQLKEKVIFQLPPHSTALAPVQIDPNNASDSHTAGSGQAGGGGNFESRVAYNLQVFKLGQSFTTAAPAIDPTRKFIGLALFWSAGTLHWLIKGDNSNTVGNGGRNRIFYYRLRIENELWYLEEIEHEINDLVYPADARVIKTANGSGVTFRARRQPAYGDPIEDYHRYLFEVSTSGGAVLHSAAESSTGDSGAEVTGILGSKVFTDNGIGSSNSTGSYVWGNLSGLEFIPIKNSVTPGSPIMENYYDGSSKYIPANNVVDRYEPYNVYGDNVIAVREDGNWTFRVYAVDGAGVPEVLYEYAPTASYYEPLIYRAYSEDGGEYLKISSTRQDSRVYGDSSQGSTNFVRLYFRSQQNLPWTLVDDMDNQTSTSNPTKIVQDLTSGDHVGQFDQYGNIAIWKNNKFWFYYPGSGYGVDLTPILFNGATSSPYEYRNVYGIAATPYGLLIIAGRPFNQLFATLPAIFILQGTPA